MNFVVLILISTAACSLLLCALFAGVLSVNNQNVAMGQVAPDRQLHDTMALDASNHSDVSDSGSKGYINTTAYWHENNHLTVYLKMEDGIKYGNIAKEYVENAAYGNSSTSDAMNYTGWNVLTNSILDPHNKQMPILIVNQEKDANIVITFTNNVDDTGHNAFGRTIMKLDQNDRTSLSSVQIFIFTTDQLYHSKLLQPVITHEMGHALGLQHSTSQKSIMYPKIVVMGNKPVGTIAKCEFDAMDNLYVHNKVGQVPC